MQTNDKSSLEINLSINYIREFLKDLFDELKTKLNNLIASTKYVTLRDNEIISMVLLKLDEIDIDNEAREILNFLPKDIFYDDFIKYIESFLVNKSRIHFAYDKLAVNVALRQIYETTPSSILESMKLMSEHGIVNETTLEFYSKNDNIINETIDNNRDLLFDYVGLSALRKAYIISRKPKKGKPILFERPQYVFMRVSQGIHGNDISDIYQTYNYMSLKYFTHATPTLFNAGTKYNQLSSCYLISIEDSLKNIYKTSIDEMVDIQASGGGIGCTIASIRPIDAEIKGSNGAVSNGIIPLCRVLNEQARYITQGGKRKGSIAVYVECWHVEILDFLCLRLNTGSENLRTRDLSLGLWMCDLFMERCANEEMWSLMCPTESKGLELVYGEEFNKLYTKYENEGKYIRQIPARIIWESIVKSSVETGFPYILFKDTANKKSNQSNLGTIRTSNLCAEIIEYSDENETAVCNLASICLPALIKNNNGKKYFDFCQLNEISHILVNNLNKVIDINKYPSEKSKRSNMKHRPIGIGVQGLYDVFNILGLDFESDEARKLDEKIHETIYFGSVDESINQARRYGSYESFNGSYSSQGKLQFDLWKEDSEKDKYAKSWNVDNSYLNYDWTQIKEKLKTYGLRNSLITALMPTATTSQIMGYSEGFEPVTSNIYVRSTLSGEFTSVNVNLVIDLIKLNLWNDEMRKLLLINEGSVQQIVQIPENLRKVYKTAFEIKQRSIIEHCAIRGKFIDQSQSMNLFMSQPTYQTLTIALYHGWKLGLKTGVYYLRSQPASKPIKFGIDIIEKENLEKQNELKKCPINCDNCGA